MIIVLRRDATPGQVQSVLQRIAQDKEPVHVFQGEERVVIVVLGPSPSEELRAALEIMPGVEAVGRSTRPYKLASREVHPEPSVVAIGQARIGEGLTIGAGVSRLHEPDELVEIAAGAEQAGAGLFWLGRPEGADLAAALPLLAYLRRRSSLPLLVDLWGPDEVDPLGSYCDGFIIGAQHLHSYPLVRAASRQKLPVMLDRGPATSIEEWLLVAEQLLKGGNFKVILCEQGVRTFETAVRATLDFSALPILKRLSHLPVAANPSLAAGRHEIVPALALGAAGAGADCVLIDVHLGAADEPSAGTQSLSLDAFRALARRLNELGAALAELR